jgi:hypothetical protein
MLGDETASAGKIAFCCRGRPTLPHMRRRLAVAALVLATASLALAGYAWYFAHYEWVDPLVLYCSGPPGEPLLIAAAPSTTERS